MAVVYREPGPSTPQGTRIGNLVPHYRPLSRAGPSLAQHPRLRSDRDRESPPFTRFFNSFRSWGMSEALMKTLWRDSALLSGNLHSGSFWFILASSASIAERTRRARSSLPIH